MAKMPKPDELLKTLDWTPPEKDWMDDVPPEIKPGRFCYPAKKNILEEIGFPNPREWSPLDDDWKLPSNSREIVVEGIIDRLKKYRSFKLFMDICVRCGACADKCHYFLGSGDPKNMPVLRAELLRSVIKGELTWQGKFFGKLAGARKLNEDIIKEWFYYFYQCSECRRCSVFCPYGIDTCEVTMMGRELLHLVGCNINWILEPVRNCFKIGNHLGLQPHTVKENIEFLCWDIEEVTGLKMEVPFNKKGAEVLFVTPSGDYFADPGIYTMMGYIMLFNYLDIDWTMSTYASEGGNFGLFTSHEAMAKINAKIYHEAERLGVRFIIGGECGHMWRVKHQYMDTATGPAPKNLEVPRSPITGTVFEHAKSTKMIHICEFTADLIAHGKLDLDPSRNDKYVVTYHDSCNPSRGMGFFEEPRFILKNVCNNFYEMPENTIREKTFCCGSGSGLNTDEFMDMRMRGGLPRANAVKYVHEKYGVNMLACICAIDRAALPTLMNYWVPEVQVCGVHELVANALVFPHEKKGERERELNLRQEPLKPEGEENA
ncbi:4Fe-4S ferredoxin, iron-sulfur binding protein [Thermodesulfatator indicus DSM 15286]|uniref:4Fe-4S ferredoxin, iron-sulfur binding protein n=1 Tax=Thermodesulfatator indicus (strain DSM 15286 / JCM 11887 / CIR29812) TaxID=667014 RepID=F8A998_THEID|nr:(Fe-S)-binding protein [Thermodesulfatator indicus]AEH45411.1 4Fe-4S ferredoxin, iron-sulfur binding protein [Thermodesulfatator indicus DSM 15286]